MRSYYLCSVLVCALLVSSVQAQDDDDLFAPDDSGEPTASDDSEEPTDLSESESLSDGDETETSPALAEQGGPEKPLSWFVGLQGRLNWVPTLIPEIFLDEVPAIVGPGFTVTGSWRSNSDSGFGVSFGIGYLDYAADGPFRESGDPPQDTEYIDSTLGLVYLSGTMFWSTRFSEMFVLEYGFGLDFGIVTGELRRTEAYRTDENSDEYFPCYGAGYATESVRNPSYCGWNAVTDVNDDGEHYNLAEDSIPPVFAFPAIPQLALRFEPDPMVAIKLQIAYGIAQLCFGLAAEIGVEAL